MDAESLGLVELLDGLDVGAEVELLVLLELRDTVIINQIRQGRVDVSKRGNKSFLCVVQLCEKNHAYREMKTKHLHVMVVGVEPLLHLLGLNVDLLLGLGGRLLDTTANGKVALVAIGKMAETLGDDVEHDRVVKDVVVEGEVTRRDLGKTLGLLELPVLSAELDGSLVESLLGDLAGPEVLNQLLGLALTALSKP